MSKILMVKFTWDTVGAVFPRYSFRANLTQNEEKKFVAYSVIGFLLHQLSLQHRKHGLNTVKGIFEGLSSNYSSKPINTDLIRARMNLLVSGSAVVATFHPKIKFFSRNAEAAVSTLVGNYAKRVLSDGVEPYTGLLKVSLLSIIIAYREATYKPENYFSPIGGDNKLAPGVKSGMVSLNMNFYNDYWANPQGEVDLDEFQVTLQNWKWKLE